MSQIAPNAYREEVEVEVRRPFKASDINAIRLLQNDLCAWCPSSLSPFEADHIIPRALGGKTDRANCQLLCVKCHKAKTRNDRRMIAKAERIRRKLSGQVTRHRAIVSRGFNTSGNLYRSVDGQVRSRERPETLITEGGER